MSLVIKTENNEVVHSGSVFTYTNCSTLQLDVDIENNFQFSIEFSFVNKENEGQSICPSLNEQIAKVTIECINFNNSLGTGTTIPIELGTYKGKRISIHFWAYSLGTESVQKVEFCIYKEL